jgi:hypothetical protein
MDLHYNLQHNTTCEPTHINSRTQVIRPSWNITDITGIKAIVDTFGQSIRPSWTSWADITDIIDIIVSTPWRTVIVFNDIIVVKTSWTDIREVIDIIFLKGS